jgi:hypothetical protein
MSMDVQERSRNGNAERIMMNDDNDGDIMFQGNERYANESRDLANDELRRYNYEALPLPQCRIYVNEKRFDGTEDIGGPYVTSSAHMRHDSFAVD